MSLRIYRDKSRLADVYLGVVRGLFDDFGRHPERRADERLALAGGVGQLAGDAEVSQFHVTRLRQQHVRRYQTHTRARSASRAPDHTHTRLTALCPGLPG